MNVFASTFASLGEDGVERATFGAAPSAFRIWRAGSNPTDKGDTIFTPLSAKLIMGDQVRRNNLYSIDVDHMSVEGTAPPESRKAVGWHRLAIRDSEKGPELWAVDVEWTEAVRAGLESNPPEWRYFSPAYSVDSKTREVTGYLNTALTNNPATWAVTALATRTTECTVMTRSKMKAFLAKMAASEGASDEAKQAYATIAAVLGDDPEEKTAPAPAPAKEEASAAPAKDAPPEEEEAKKTTAVAASAGGVDLLARVHNLEIALRNKEEAEERSALLASRPDFSAGIKAVLASSPIATVRLAVKNFERGTAALDPAAAEKVTATRGATQNETGVARLPADQKKLLDTRMGIGVNDAPAVNHVGNHSFYSALGSVAKKEGK
jgi:hypothetical protein